MLAEDFFQWPIANAGNNANLNGWAYTPATNAAGVALGTDNEGTYNASGRFVNYTGSAQTVRRFDIDLDVTQLPNDGDSTPTVIFRSSNAAGDTFGGGAGATTGNPVNTLGIHTITFILNNDVSIEAGGGFSLAFLEFTAADVPLGVNVVGVRVSSDTTEALVEHQSFLTLTDTANTGYAGRVNQIPTVNETETGLTLQSPLHITGGIAVRTDFPTDIAQAIDIITTNGGYNFHVQVFNNTSGELAVARSARLRTTANQGDEGGGQFIDMTGENTQTHPCLLYTSDAADEG